MSPKLGTCCLSSGCMDGHEALETSHSDNKTFSVSMHMGCTCDSATAHLGLEQPCGAELTSSTLVPYLAHRPCGVDPGQDGSWFLDTPVKGGVCSAAKLQQQAALLWLSRGKPVQLMIACW
jgi:hypothetical protein